MKAVNDTITGVWLLLCLIVPAAYVVAAIALSVSRNPIGYGMAAVGLLALCWLMGNDFNKNEGRR